MLEQAQEILVRLEAMLKEDKDVAYLYRIIQDVNIVFHDLFHGNAGPENRYAVCVLLYCSRAKYFLVEQKNRVKCNEHITYAIQALQDLIQCDFDESQAEETGVSN